MNDQPRSLRVAAAQTGPADDRKECTTDRLVGLVAQAGTLGVDLLVFPELALTPYFATRVHDDISGYLDEPESSPHVARVLAATAREGIVCVLPFAEPAPDGVYNSALVAERDGSICGIYQKMHIPGQQEPSDGDASLERRYFADGANGFPVFDTSVGRVGVLICADRSFPEGWRILGLAGAEIVATPHNTSTMVPHDRTAAHGSVAELQRMQSVRMAGNAASNSYHVISAGKAGHELGYEYIGDSQVIGPWGQVLARAGSAGDELVVADVRTRGDDAEYQRTRKLLRRRPAEYGALVAEPALELRA